MDRTLRACTLRAGFEHGAIRRQGAVSHMVSVTLTYVLEVLQTSGVVWALETVLSFVHICMDGLQYRSTTAPMYDPA